MFEISNQGLPLSMFVDSEWAIVFCPFLALKNSDVQAAMAPNAYPGQRAEE